MAAQFRVVRGLLSLKSGPQDLAPGAATLVIWIFLSMLAALGYQQPGVSIAGVLLLNAMDLAAVYLIALALLSMKGLQSRLTQTFTALVATSTVLTALLVPVFLIWPVSLEADTIPAVALVAMLFVFGWLLVTFGHILQQALALRGRMTGVAIALGMVLVPSIVSQLALALAFGLAGGGAAT